MFVVCVAIFVLPMLQYSGESEGSDSQKAVLTMWHVESFEGGSTSRRDWLLRRAAEWEKSNKGMYINITTYTYEQAVEMLNKGYTFDIISFGAGLGSELLGKLVPWDRADVWDNFAQSATVEGKLLALPYMSGAYMLFARQDVVKLSEPQQLVDKCLTFDITKRIGKNTVKLLSLDSGFAAFNNPVGALAMQGITGSLAVDTTKTQYNTYEAFVSGNKSVVLLGTQRDLYRLSNREKQGKISPLVYASLVQYTDLAQYVGVCADSKYIQLAQAFCYTLIDDKAQATLYSTGMCSVVLDDIYTDERYCALQMALQNSYVANVFRDASTIQADRQSALNTVNGK